MNFKLDVKSAILGAMLVLTGALAAEEVPGLIQHVFKPGDPIRAAEVNANFANLGNAVQLLQGESRKPITTDRLEDGSVTASKLKSQTAPANGQFLGYQDGRLTWGAVAGPKGEKGDPGPQGPAGRDAPSPASKVYTKITESWAQVRGNFTKGFIASCDSLSDRAISGIVEYKGGERLQYLEIASSYPAGNSGWTVYLDNEYGDGSNPNSIIYVDVGVVCMRE